MQGGVIMDIQPIGVYMSGLVIIFLYAMSQFNKLPPGDRGPEQEGSAFLSTVRQWFQFKDLPPPLISPPLRANTTAFKYWLYRLTYALIWVFVYLVIMRVPGVRESIPGIIKVITGNAHIADLNLTNGVVVAFVIMLLTRIPPFRGADATIRQAMYERACIPAQQLGFQYLLRGASYEPDVEMVLKTKKTLAADGFASQDIDLDPAPTTRSLWAKASVLMAYIEEWGKNDRYKTALALLREPASEKLSADRVRNDYDALMSDARVCLAELKSRPDAEKTLLREEQFRKNCKALLEAIYSLLTHAALRSHYSYFDAIAAAKKIGFNIQGSVAPLPDKNDVVALSIMLFIVTTIPLAYRLGPGRAISITGIYLLAALTPIYLAAECPRLLKRKRGGVPPLTFPLASGAIAAVLAAATSIGMNSICYGDGCLQLFDLNNGFEQLLNRSYPWVVLVFFLTALLAVLMLVGEYPAQTNLKGYARCRKWGNIRDAMVIAGCVLGLMALYVIPELHRLAPDRFPESVFWRSLATALRPVISAFFIGFFVPTWFRGNALRIRKDQEQHLHVQRPQVEGIPVSL
jgi:hypothetical protein